MHNPLPHIYAVCRHYTRQAGRGIKAARLWFVRKQRNAMMDCEADSGRITAKTVFLNFADVWGFGSRSIFRTIGHLMWRPGYMIRDYIEGKRNKYLQPINLLIVTTLIFLQAAYFLNVEIPKWNDITPRTEKRLSELTFEESEAERAQKTISFMVKCARNYDNYRHWRDDNRAFGMVAHSLLSVFLVWLLFRKSPRKSKEYYNFAEISTAILYILCQLQVFSVIFILITRDVHDIDTAILLPGILVQLVMIVDFKQLFQRSWWSTIWRTLLSVTWII